jgi:murein DD-endopeptidase MepM/ murein hydrolase activator NlpD
MRAAGDHGVAEPVAKPRPGEVRESLAERLERAHAERQREELERRAALARKRERRDRAWREGMERRQRERDERLQRELALLRSRRRAGERPETSKPAGTRPGASKRAGGRPGTSKHADGRSGAESPPVPAKAQVRPGVKGPVRKRARAAENRRRETSRRRGLFWPTAKAGLAATVALGLSAALGSLFGLPVPGAESGGTALSTSAALFGVDAGTPTGLSSGYVFPIIGPHDFGDKIARFGAPRYGHVHEGQDIFAKSGRTEVAVHDGVVVDRGTNRDPDSGGRGNYVAIYSPSDNHSFVYMHMLKPSPVQVGDQVHAGETIGQVGCTGECDGPHLHFEVRIGRASFGAETKAVDPLPYLRQWPQSTPG